MMMNIHLVDDEREEIIADSILLLTQLCVAGGEQFNDDDYLNGLDMIYDTWFPSSWGPAVDEIQYWYMIFDM